MGEKKTKPPQEQSHQPGLEGTMQPKPEAGRPHRSSDKLLGQVAVITGTSRHSDSKSSTSNGIMVNH